MGSDIEKAWRMFIEAYPSAQDGQYNNLETTNTLHQYYHSNFEGTITKLEFESMLIENGYNFLVLSGEKQWMIK